MQCYGLILKFQKMTKTIYENVSKKAFLVTL